jgi:hypothetical protein
MKGIPAPDSPFDHGSYPQKFAFDRLGVRVPMMVVSPLVAKGLVVSHPLTEGTYFEHCSILKTVRELLGAESGPLTKRGLFWGDLCFVCVCYLG